MSTVSRFSISARGSSTARLGFTVISIWEAPRAEKLIFLSEGKKILQSELQ